MIRFALRPLARLYEFSLLTWALNELPPTHPAVPAIVLRVRDRTAPSPLDPADSIVTGACILAALALLVLMVLGALPGGA